MVFKTYLISHVYDIKKYFIVPICFVIYHKYICFISFIKYHNIFHKPWIIYHVMFQNWITSEFHTFILYICVCVCVCVIFIYEKNSIWHILYITFHFSKYMRIIPVYIYMCITFVYLIIYMPHVHANSGHALIRRFCQNTKTHTL